MTFDAWTAAAVADELREKLVGGRVQQVIQVDQESLALEVYAGGQRRYLLASASRQWPRLHLVSDRLRRGVDGPSPLLQIARKVLRGSILTEVARPAWERLIALRFVHPAEGATLLVAELISRRSNLLLLRPADSATAAWPAGSWRIAACVHRSLPEEGARASIPGRLYAPLPPPPGAAPDALTAEDLERLWADNEPTAPAWRALVHGVQGMSPLLAREVVWRATGDAHAPVERARASADVLRSLREMVTTLERRAWQPCVALDAAGRPTAFAPYPLLHRAGPSLSGLAPAESISAAAQRFYEATIPAAADPYGAARSEVMDALRRRQERLRRRREAIAKEMVAEEEVEALRRAGEWILALATQIEPRQSTLHLPDEAGGGVIALDPSLSPVENAALYFKRYRKARRARVQAGPRLAQVEADLAYLDQLAADLALADNRAEIEAVAAALADLDAAHDARRRAATPPVTGPRRFVTPEGYTVWVGRNSRQNDQVTFEMAHPDDLWLHARGVPGAHVVIRSGGRPVGEASLRSVAALAAYYSAGRHEAWVDVLVALRRRVRRAAGGRPGMVTVQEEQVLRVRPAVAPSLLPKQSPAPSGTGLTDEGGVEAQR